MKQLRAEGIQKLAKAAEDDCVQLLRLSRQDEALQTHFTAALHHLEYATTRATEIVVDRERTDA